MNADEMAQIEGMMRIAAMMKTCAEYVTVLSELDRRIEDLSAAAASTAALMKLRVVTEQLNRLGQMLIERGIEAAAPEARPIDVAIDYVRAFSQKLDGDRAVDADLSTGSALLH